jgi:quercetin dioxygenase-like cupin family protein
MITRRRLLVTAGTVAAPFAAGQSAGQSPGHEAQSPGQGLMDLVRAGSVPTRMGSLEYFTGVVRIDMPFKGRPPARVAGATVTFEPGARTAWHTHPLGQTLIVTSGTGWVQLESGAKEEIRLGDIVFVPAGKKHWHGATATTRMTHIAFSEGLDSKTVDWLEKVSDQQYGG